jgi:hypothetical protein
LRLTQPLLVRADPHFVAIRLRPRRRTAILRVQNSTGPIYLCSIHEQITGGTPASKDLARRGSDQSAKCPREVGGIREPGNVSRVGN